MGFFDRQQTAPGAQPRQMSQKEMQQAFMRDVNGLRENTAQYIQRAGMNIPQNLRGDPQTMAMHLIQSGQVPQERLRMVQPLINRMMGRR